jgi:hypothetical protein
MMCLPRFRIGTLMIAVAVVALSHGVVRETERRATRF